ncbi:MAG: AsmA-like C-terminal region-containing protein [Planctomycetota bacterium]
MNSNFFPSQRPRTSSIGLAWRLLKIAIFVGLIGIVVWLFIQKTVHSHFAELVQQRIDAELKDTGLVAELGDAQFFEHKGIRLVNLAVDLDPNLISTSDGQTSQLEVYELFVHGDASMTDLAGGNFKPTAIELKRARLTLVQDADGVWDFEPIIEWVTNLQGGDLGPVPVVLSDCEVKVINQQNRLAAPIVLSGINFSIHRMLHEGRELTQVTGQFKTRAISNVQVTAFVDHTRQAWHCQLDANQARVSRDLVNAIPPDLGGSFDSLKALNGTIDFGATATGQLGSDLEASAMPTFSLSGQVSNLSIDDERLPVPIRNLSATFSVGNDGFAVNNAQGGLGDDGSFKLNYRQAGLLQSAAWHADGNVKNFRFDDRPRLSNWLPKFCQQFCRDYSPEGTSNVEFDLTFDGRKLSKTLTGHLTDMSFSYVKLPYQVDHCVGIVKWVDDHCEFDVRSKIAKEPVRIHGSIENPGVDSTYQLDISVPGTIPIDQKMLAAIDAQTKLAKVIRSFNPQGRVGGLARLERRIPHADVIRSYDVRLKGCEVRHNEFDYPISNVEGLVRVRGDKYTFHDLQGSNSSGTVGCNGSFSRVDGLSLRFLCDDVPLNDQLKFALKPEIRDIWNGFRPRGTLDFLKVDLELPPGRKKIELAVEAVLQESEDDPEANYVSIFPVWFPYQINHLTGTIKLAGGQITLKDISGSHQKTWVACKGQGHYSDQSWSLRLEDLLVSSLKVDEDLLAAVPPTMAPTLSKLRYDGLMNVDGEITLAGDKSPPLGAISSYAQRKEPFAKYESNRGGTYQALKPRKRTSMAWDLQINMSQANMQIGLPVENVFGAIQLTGLFDGTSLDCDGMLDIDSMTIYDQQITNVKGPLRIENDRVLAGVFARRSRTDPSGNLSPVTALPQPISAMLHDGSVELDAQLDSSAGSDFYLQAKINDSCLATACRELAPELQNVEGHSYAEIRLRGDGSGTHSLRGVGNIQLKDAKIYELPIFLSLLKVLKVRQPSRTAFDSGTIDFSVQGETLVFDRMEFNGDAISLIGNGQLNLDRDINLDFYSVMGRNRINIPLLTNLMRAGSQQVLHITVDGKLDDPQLHQRVLPQLSELKQLFQQRDADAFRRDNLVSPASASIPIGQSYFQQENDAPFQLQIK